MNDARHGLARPDSCSLSEHWGRVRGRTGDGKGCGKEKKRQRMSSGGFGSPVRFPSGRLGRASCHLHLDAKLDQVLDRVLLALVECHGCACTRTRMQAEQILLHSRIRDRPALACGLSQPATVLLTGELVNRPSCLLCAVQLYAG